MELDYETRNLVTYSDSFNAKVVVRATGKVVKRFRNKETAWSDANRWADDNDHLYN